MADEKFTQAEWSAGTVNQTVNNYPFDLSRLSLEEKVDIIVRKIVGSDWHNEPGIMPTLHRVTEAQRRSERERRTLFVCVAVLFVLESAMLMDMYFLG